MKILKAVNTPFSTGIHGFFYVYTHINGGAKEQKAVVDLKK